MNKMICSVNGCESPVKCKCLCNKHYQRSRIHGDVNAFNAKRGHGCLVPSCDGKHRAHGYCLKHYTRFIRYGDVDHVEITVGDNKKRLMDSTEISASGCWEWKKRIHDGGYGVVSLNGRLEQAHRASWMVFVGEIPQGMQVNHRCHNRSCINPEHLYIGTQTENMKDMKDAGRENRATGERNGNARLTKGMVLSIKLLLKEGKKSKEIASVFGVAPTTVSAIKNKKIWLGL